MLIEYFLEIDVHEIKKKIKNDVTLFVLEEKECALECVPHANCTYRCSPVIRWRRTKLKHRGRLHQCPNATWYNFNKGTHFIYFFGTQSPLESKAIRATQTADEISSVRPYFRQLSSTTLVHGALQLSRPRGRAQPLHASLDPTLASVLQGGFHST